mmetsp:Transcript_9345/g.15232  ORF Transcript_9345/g.15232 Transcript_9345/m.15232 type:complete len:205 (-) Transcript_9345:1629-2243(-)
MRTSPRVAYTANHGPSSNVESGTAAIGLASTRSLYLDKRLATTCKPHSDVDVPGHVVIATKSKPSRDFHISSSLKSSASPTSRTTRMSCEHTRWVIPATPRHGFTSSTVNKCTKNVREISVMIVALRLDGSLKRCRSRRDSPFFSLSVQAKPWTSSRVLSWTGKSLLYVLRTSSSTSPHVCWIAQACVIKEVSSLYTVFSARIP